MVPGHLISIIVIIHLSGDKMKREICKVFWIGIYLVFFMWCLISIHITIELISDSIHHHKVNSQLKHNQAIHQKLKEKNK